MLRVPFAGFQGKITGPDRPPHSCAVTEGWMKGVLGKRIDRMEITRKWLYFALTFGLAFLLNLPPMPAKEVESSQFGRLCQRYLDSPQSGVRKKNLELFCARTKNRQLAGLGYFLIGYTELQNESYPSSCSYLKKASAYPTPIEDYFQYFWAESLYRSQNLAEAKEKLASYLSRFVDSPFRAKALELYREACLASNDPQAVLDSMRFSADVAADPDALFDAARAYEALGQLNSAMERYLRLYYLFPLYNEIPAVALKMSSLSRSYPGPAVPEEWKAARIEKLYLAKKYSEVLQDLRPILQTGTSFSQNPQYQLWEGVCLFGTGRYLEAVEIFRALQSSDPELQAQAGFVTAECYRKMDQYKNFEETVEKLGQKHPASKWFEEALFSLGNYNLVTRDLNRALAAYEKLLDYFPNGVHAIDAHWRVSWQNYRLHEWERALEKFLEHPVRFRESPYIAGTLYWAGRCQEKLGKKVEADQIYLSLQHRSPNSYYGQLARRRLSSATAGNVQLTPPLERAFSILDQRSKDPNNLDWTQLQPLAEISWPRVGALATTRLFDLAASELQRKRVYGESPILDFQVARLLYQGKSFHPAIILLRRLIPGYQDTSFNSLPRFVWEIFYPADYLPIISRESRKYGLDSYWILSLIRQESAFNPKAISSANAYGLMQLLPTTARMIAKQMRLPRPTPAKLQDPGLNIRLGARHFADLLKRFDGQLELALASYNAGPERVQEWVNEQGYEDNAEFVETVPFSETRNYVKVISRSYWFYKTIYGGESRTARVKEDRNRTKVRK
jgi:soluble lytic murein transglycosylase